MEEKREEQPQELEKAEAPKPKAPDTLDELAAGLKLEPWKVAAVKAKFHLAGNSELSEAKLKELVADIEGIQVGALPETAAPAEK